MTTINPKDHHKRIVEAADAFIKAWRSSCNITKQKAYKALERLIDEYKCETINRTAEDHRSTTG